MNAYYIGAYIGGSLAVYVMSLLLGRIFFRKQHEKKKIIYSVALAFIVAVIISGFGAADGGPFNPQIATYFISSVIVLAYRFIIYALLNNKSPQEDKREN